MSFHSGNIHSIFRFNIREESKYSKNYGYHPYPRATDDHDSRHYDGYQEHPIASPSQHSFYDDDISDLENSVLGHISNAAFTNHHFYDNRDLVRPEYHHAPRPRDEYREPIRPDYDDHPPSRPRKSFYHDERDHYEPEHYKKEKYFYPAYEEKRTFYDKLLPPPPTPPPPPPPSHPPPPQRAPDDYRYDEYNHREPKHGSFFDYDDYKSYGSRLYPREPQYKENRHLPSKYYDRPLYDDHYRPELEYPLNSGYKPLEYYESLYDDKPDEEESVLDNIKKNLPWPLSMVGRMGKESKEEDRTKYPDSIQSILAIVKSDWKEDEDGASYSSHQVLPFLDINNNDVK